MSDTDQLRAEFEALEASLGGVSGRDFDKHDEIMEPYVSLLMQTKWMRYLRGYQAGRAAADKELERTKGSLRIASNALTRTEGQAAEYRAQASALTNGLRRVMAELAEAKKDTERLDYLDKNRIGLFTVVDVVRRPTTRPSPRYEEVHEFAGWSAQNRNDEMPTARAAIDAAMNKGAEKMGQAQSEESHHAVPGNESSGPSDLSPALGWSDKLAGS